MELDFKKITIEDKPLFDKFFKEFPPEMSEFTFTNLFVFRESKKTMFCLFEGHLVVRIEKEGKKIFYEPVGKNPEMIIRKIFQINPEAEFERVSLETGEKLKDTHKIGRDPDNDDYVYMISDLMQLAGQKYAPKRNFITRFMTNNPSISAIDDSAINKCMQLEEEWCNLRECKKDNMLCAEYLAIKDALAYFNELNLFGIAVFVEDKVVAFAIGEPLNKNTFVEHFEKANDKLTGAYQYTLNEFCRNIPTNFTYLNREQDLGMPGLRKSKESYYPARMVEKCRIAK